MPFAISFNEEAYESAMNRIQEMACYHVRLTFVSGVQKDATLVGAATTDDGYAGVEFAEVFGPLDTDDSDLWQDADDRATAGKTRKARLYDEVVDIYIY